MSDDLRREKSPISTPARYLYLNFWGLFLTAMGLAVGIIPLYNVSAWWLLLQIPLALVLLKGGLTILGSWGDKKRKYNILIERNRDEIRPETFREFMNAPCGRLLTIVVLKDLGKSEEYPKLKKLRVPIMDQIKNCRFREKSVVYVRENGEMKKIGS